MKKLVLSLFILCTLAMGAFAQERTVSGTVVASEDGLPIPGVSVKVKETSGVGTTTGADGKFTLRVPSNGKTLVISYLGYITQETAVRSGSINVILVTDSKLLNEVVVTAGGLEVRKKEQGTVSTTVRSETLVAAKPVNIASGLIGKVAGLQINATGGGVNPNYRLVLRGMRSLTGNNEALVVLDNVIVPNSILSNLNPEDIEDITVLNGSGAAALYGSSASNGALIVKTKKGVRGKTSVRVSNTTTIEQVAFYPGLQHSFGSGSDNDVQIYLPEENQQYGPAFDGVVRPIGYGLANGVQQSVPYSYSNAKEDFWANGLQNQSDLAVSSGDANGTIYFSGQYANVNGTTPKDKFNRASGRLNGTRNLSDKLTLNFSTTYTQNRYDQTTQTATIYDQLLNTPGQIPLNDFKDWKNDPYADPSGYYNAFYNNPYFMIDNYRQAQRNDYFVGSADLKYTPLQWLDLTARVGLTTRNYSTKSYSDKYTFNDAAKAHGSYKAQDIVGGVTDRSLFNTRLFSEFQATVRKTVDVFKFSLTGGASLQQNQSKDQSANISGLVNPGLFNLNNSTTPPTATEENYKAREIGAYGLLKIGFKDYLFLEVTGRNDWVSILSPKNRSFFYPAANLSFVATDAISALKNVKFLDFLKLRGGVSKVGQVNLGANFGAYRLEPTFNQASGYPYNGQGGYSVGNTLVSADLRPEITKGFEVGFDANFLKNKITTSFTYYSTNTTDQTVTTGVSSVSGFSNFLTNTGKTSSKGAEFTLHVTPIRTDKWEVTVGGNYTKSKNEVLSISADVPRITLGAYGSLEGTYAVEGQPFPVLMARTHVRDDQGRIIVNSITGYPTGTQTVSVMGSATPTDILALDLSVRFMKNLRFSALAEYRGGNYIYNAGGGGFEFSGAGINTVMFNRERFVIPNSSYLDATTGKYVANTNITVRDGGPGYWTIGGPRRSIGENYVTSGAFWKLREVTLAYDLPKSLLAKSKFISNATISAQGRNLFIWLPKTNVYTDPEYSDGDNLNSGNAIGLTNLGQTPPSRYYGLSLSLTF
jgi:TonB-linked SusC/RagA family outer membrane protein